MTLGSLGRSDAWRAAALGLLAAAAGYQHDVRMALPLGSGIEAVGTSGLHGPESGYRWSTEQARITIPEPGPGRAVRVEVDVSAWRPRGQARPRVQVEAGTARRETQLSPAVETIPLDITTAGVWSSDLELKILAETFTPGAGDERRLGVRVHEVRLLPRGPWRPRRPPLGLALAAAALLLFGTGLVAAAGLRPAATRRLAEASALVLALAFAFTRADAALGVPLLLGLAVLAFVLATWTPGALRLAGEALAESARAARDGALSLPAGAIAGVLAAGAVALAVAYTLRPRIDVDLGSPRDVAVTRSFGGYDAEGGVTYRHTPGAAAVDLRDFGAGTRWRIEVTAALPQGPRALAVARAGGSQAEAVLGPEWTTVALEAASPLRWRSGLLVEIPAAGRGRQADLRVDHVRVDRGRSLPSPRVVLSALAAALLLALATAAAGGGGRVAVAVAGAALTGVVAAVASDPVTVVPFVSTFLCIAGGGFLVSAVAAGVVRLLARRGASGLPPPGALVAAGLGFVAWWSASAFPLYRGGHFGFHSSIAEEIWKGRFLLYYLPYPGSMLSRQAQWGDVIVPHPCSFHTVVSPLAALPREWFHFLEKGVLASWLACLVVVSALLGRRTGGERAAVFAAVLAAGMPPAFQLLGLGHLMTLFGCWAASLALAFVLLRFDDLPRRATFWTAAGLLTLCFVSYTACLLFAALILTAAAVLLYRRHPGPVRSLVLAGVVAGVAAFALYYVHWTWPFLSQSVPRFLSGSRPGAEPTPVWSRLALQPAKLAYSYGTLAFPLAGLAGLSLAARRTDRVLLLAWGGVLVVFSGLDVFFNFLLKHHYFVMVPVAVGAGLTLAKLSERGRGWAVVALALVAAVLLLGARTALDVATGRIP